MASATTTQTATQIPTYVIGDKITAKAGQTIKVQASVSFIGGPAVAVGTVNANMRLSKTGTPTGNNVTPSGVLIGSASSHISLPSGQRFKWPVTVTIPANTAPGNYFVTETVSSTVPTENINVTFVTNSIQVASGPQLKIVAPQSSFSIDPVTLTMPKISAMAQLSSTSSNPASIDFSWTAKVSFTSKSPQISETQSVSLKVHGPNLVIPSSLWKNGIQGGQLTLSVQATVDGKAISASLATLKIVGQDPSSSLIRAAINAAPQPSDYPASKTYPFHLILWKIAEQENHLHQFTSSGTPAFNIGKNGTSDGGAGLMQITPATTPVLLWNWKANLNAGIAKIKQVAGIGIRRWKSELNLLTESVATLNAARTVKKLKPVTLNIPQPTVDEQVKQSIRAFNGASGEDAFGQPLLEYELQINAEASFNSSDDLVVSVTANQTAITGKWILVPATARPKTGDPNYVNNVLSQPA
ncbi:MAG TPA: hypothetical protein VHS31_13925 [Tepidisphaeraceae bacterium]|nr:hypothetical protein [Tepidisphaeraceae bacterium]